MSSKWLIGLAVVCLVWPGQAQGQSGNAGSRSGNAPEISGNTKSDEGRRGPHRRANHGPRGFGERGGYRGFSPREMVQRLPEQLNFTEEQQALFDALVEEYQPQWDAARGRRGEMRALVEQMREARRNGDAARADEIRDQMREMGRGDGRFMREFMSDVEPILNEDQLARFHQMRQRFERRHGRSRAAGEARRLLRELPEALEMTNEQRAQFDEILAAQRGQRRDMRPLFDALRAAREDGDEARVEELTAELEAKREAMRNPDALFEKIKPLLTDEQRARLAELRAQLARDKGPRDLRAILEAAKQLDLTSEQRDQLKTIMRETQVVQERGRLSRRDRAELARATKTQIADLLDADQKAEFERLLEKRVQRGERDRRRGEQRRPRGEGPRP